MSFADEQNKILSEINTLIQDSPATAKQTADNISIQPNDNADVFNTVLQTLEQNKQKEIESQPKEIGLGGVFALGDLKAQAKLAASNEPIDKSTGVDIPATSEATQKIATNRVLGVGGPSDYMQRIGPLETETMGAASSGTNDGDLDVANLRAGNAGLNVSTESTLNPFDGSEGNPAFFGGRYPLLQTTVAPFKVTFPDYNLEVMSETLDPEKLAYQAATMIGGRQMPTYIGYTNSGFDLTESWYSGLAKGIANAPINLADLGVKAGTFYTAADLYARAYFEYGLSKYLFGDNPNDTEKKLAKRLSDINYIVDDTVEDWNKVVSAYKSKFGSELTEYADWSTKLFEGVPAVLAQMGAIYGISTLASQAVVSPKAASLLTSTIAGTTFGFAQGADTFAGLEGAAINPARRMARATASAGASAVLNSLGAWTVFGNKVSAGRQFIKDYAKRLRVAAGKGALGMLGEGATETADQILQDYFTYNMGDDTFANRLDTYTMSFVLGAVGGLAGVPGHISAEKMQIFKEQVLAGKVAADAPDFVKELDLAVNKMYEAGFDKEFTWDVIVGMASPKGQAYLKKKQTDTLMGMLDRLSPEAIQYAKDLGAKESARFMNELAQLDQQVYKNLPNELDDSTKTMVSRAMRGIASVVTYYGGKFTTPKFVIRNDAPMEYDPKKNIIYINSVATGEAIDIGMVQDKKMRLLDPMQRGLLHELGHMMDYQLGRGTNYKDFMPAYFEAIAKVYGKDKAQNIQKQMNKTGDRFAFATSIKKADVKEKQQDAATGRISEKNTAEYFAYALGRLGKKVGRALGMADSEVAQHVDAINIMASTLKIPSIQKQLSRYQKAMGDLVKKNDATLKAMAKAQGLDELARHIQDFVAGDENALSKEDVLNLYNILKTYSGVDGAAILDEVFKNSKQETFMQHTEREFADSIKESDITIGDVQNKINELNKKAANKEKKQDTISGEDLPTFYGDDKLNEQIAYVSTRGPLEGEHLDADRYYATGEARGHKGRAMRWGYGNYLNKSPVINKENYYDSFLSDALKRPRSKLHGFPKGVPDLEMDMLVAYLETKAKPGESIVYKKDDIIKELNQGVAEAKQNAEDSHKEFEKAYDEVKKYSKYYEYLGAFVHEPTESQMINMLSSDFYDTITEADTKKLFGVIDGYSFKEFKKAHEAAKKVYDLRMQDFRTHDQVVKEERMRYEIEQCLTDESSIEILPEEKVVLPEQHAMLIPDNEYFLDAQSSISGQTKFVKDRINKIAEEYGWWDSEYILSPNSRVYDMDVSEVNGEEFYHWLANHIAQEQGISNKVDAYRFARDVLADSGIKGIRTFGHRDMETFNVFRSEDTRKYKRLHEGVFDVSTVLGDQKKKFVSTLEKRTAEKPDGYNYADDVKAVTGIMAESGKTPRWFTKFFANGDVTMGLWAMGGKKLVEHFDLIGRMNRSSNVAMDHMLDFDSKLKQIMGFKSNIERDAFENQASINNIDVDYTVDPLTDEIISTKVSPLVVMNLYNTAKNSKTRAKVLNTFGGNGMEMERVLNSLTDEQRAYADAMTQYIKDNWSEYKKSYEQEGIEIADEPYWPVADAVHIALGDRKINSSYARKEDPRGAISLDVDAREVFNHYVQRVAGAKENVYSTIQRIKDLFGYEKSSNTDNPTDEVRKLSDDMWNESKKIRGLAVRNLGVEGRYNRFLSLLDDFLEKRESSMVGTESLNIAARNLTAGLLQWKPIQFMKNLANAAGFWGLAENQAQYWSDTAWAATHPIEAAKYMFEKVPYIRNRFKGQNIDEALTQQTAGTDSLVMNWAKNSQKLSAGGQQIVSNLVALTQASRRLGYTPILSGDMAANVIGGYGLLRQYEAQYGDKAGDKLSEAIVMHQASNNQALRSLLQRQWSRDIRGEVLRFGSEGVQKGKSIGLAIAQGVKGERPWGNVSKEILSTMSSMILFALISAGVIDLFDGDEENDKEVYEALTREGISAVAGFSVVGNSIIAPILSIPFTGEMSTIGTPLTNMLSADLKKLNKGDWEDLVVDGIAATVPITGLDNLINLGKGGYRSATAQSEEDFAAGLYQLMGRSESYANKRAGIKKETIENSEEE